MATTKTFRPIDWSDTAGTGWFNTASSTNKKSAGTAMFYGASFEAAGWLAVFKNTESTTVKITKVKGLIGTRQSDNVKAKVVCKVLGTSFNKDTATISTGKSNVTNISNSIPKKDTLSVSRDTTTITLSKALEVKSGEYFCIGFLGTDIPSGKYFNMALRRLTSNVKNVFYAQDANTSKTITWYRSGNANDGTNWKKHYAYIWAEGTVAEVKATNPPITKPPVPPPSPSPPPPPQETGISLTLTPQSLTIPQGSETVITVNTSFTKKDDPNNTLNNAPTWTVKTASNSNFAITKSGNTITVKSKTYVNHDLSIVIEVVAASGNGTNLTDTKSVTIQATAPTIDSLTVTKSILRPTETSNISCTYSTNAGGVTYTLNGSYVSLSGRTITALPRTDGTTGLKATLIATTKNGGVTKSIDIALNHWAPEDLQVYLSSNTIYADSFTGADGSTIKVINGSTNGLNVKYELIENTILSFSNTTQVDKLTGDISVSTEKILYTKGTISSNTTDTLKAYLSCDTIIAKTYDISLFAAATADIKYPLGLQSVNTINFPVIARKNVSGKYEVYFSTYPIVFTINNDNNYNIKVELLEGSKSLKIGSLFVDNILKGTYSLRPEVAPRTYSESAFKNLNGRLSLQYTLKVSQCRAGVWQNVFTKAFSINYTIYKDYSEYEASTTTAANFDLISLKDQGQQMTAVKAGITLNIARDILSEYGLGCPNSIVKYGLVNNSYTTDLPCALKGLYTLIDRINNNSHSLVVLPLHRTALVPKGNYIMADDSVPTLANGAVNPLKDYYKNLNNPTASPFREIVKAVYNLTGPVEHYSINHKSNGTSYNISKINGVPIGKLYL